MAGREIIPNVDELLEISTISSIFVTNFPHPFKQIRDVTVEFKASGYDAVFSKLFQVCSHYPIENCSGGRVFETGGPEGGVDNEAYFVKIIAGSTLVIGMHQMQFTNTMVYNLSCNFNTNKGVLEV